MGIYLHSQLVWLPCRQRAEYNCLQCNAASTKQEQNLTCILHEDFFRSPKGNVTALRLQKCTPGYVPCFQFPKNPTQQFSHCTSLSAYAPGFLSSQGVPKERGRNGTHLNLVQTCNQHTTGPGRDTWVIQLQRNLESLIPCSPRNKKICKSHVVNTKQQRNQVLLKMLFFL